MVITEFDAGDPEATLPLGMQLISPAIGMMGLPCAIARQLGKSAVKFVPGGAP
jgi:hypothetical protein